jgi:hypothetical protein
MIEVEHSNARTQDDFFVQPTASFISYRISKNGNIINTKTVVTSWNIDEYCYFDILPIRKKIGACGNFF